MAMLAERKRKIKWSLNPRGNDWSNDVNKFGQKMLEKMGWSEGNGLGANLDGITVHVKINYKHDSQGLGFKENGEQWTQHEDNYSSLLENLGAPDEAVAKPEVSLEEKSRSIRNRVHYAKFTRGKDLSRRSEKDLAAIFGRKTLERVAVPEPTPEQSEVSETKSHGVETIPAGNMQDYFKSKLPRNLFNLTRDDPGSESEIGACGGLGFGASSSSFIKETLSSDLELKEAKKRKRYASEEKISEKNKKKKENFCFDNPTLEDCDAERNTDEALKRVKFALPDQADTPKVKTKRKNAFDEVAIDNLACEVLDEDASPKKKKKKSKTKDIGIDNPACEVLDEDVTPKKAKKKSKTMEIGIDNPACEVLDEEVIPMNKMIDNSACEVLNEGATPKKKKKKSKTKDIGIDNPACEILDKEVTPMKSKKNSENKMIDNSACEGAAPKKKKKKSKNKVIGIDNPACEVLDKDVTPKKAKKKSKKKNIVGIDDQACKLNTMDKTTSKRKKWKGIIKENKNAGIDNPVCEVNIVEESVASINKQLDYYQNELENEINEMKVKKPRKFKEEEVLQTQKVAPPPRSNWNAPPSGRTPQTWRSRPAPSTWPRSSGVKKESKSCKNLVKPGTLKLAFKGATLNKIPGYGLML